MINPISLKKKIAINDVMDKFVYLGSWVTKNGDCSKKIERILAIAISSNLTHQIMRRLNPYKTVKILN